MDIRDRIAKKELAKHWKGVIWGGEKSTKTAKDIWEETNEGNR